MAIVILIAFGAGRAPAQQETVPAVKRCEEFCSRVYGNGGDELEECAAACSEADACNQRCKKKFGEDAVKVRTCLRTCMSRHDSRPPEPAEPEVPGNPPVEL